MSSITSTNNNNNTIIPSAEEIRRRKIFQKGIQFCLLVLGESGAGKYTFVNNLCNRKVFDDSECKIDAEQAHLEPGFEVFSKQIQLRETNSTPINLDLVLVPGLGDNIDNSAIPDQINEYLDQQFELVLNEENRIKRQAKAVDTRPHVCLYFIRATSRGLREFDIMLMRKICDKVNLLPVISKSDLLTEEELILNKKLISKDLKDNEIKIYQFGTDKLSDVVSSEYYSNDSGVDDFDKKSPSLGATYTADTRIADIVPFSIVCSNEEYEDLNNDSETVSHIRRYSWGDIIVEDAKSSDFIFLKNIILGSHLQDLKDSTHNVLYENYRSERLTQKDVGSYNNSNTNEVNTMDMSNLRGVMNSLGQDLEQSFTSMHGNENAKQNGSSSEALTRELEEKEKLIIAYQKKLADLKNMLQISSTMSI